VLGHTPTGGPGACGEDAAHHEGPRRGPEALAGGTGPPVSGEVSGRAESGTGHHRHAHALSWQGLSSPGAPSAPEPLRTSKSARTAHTWGQPPGPPRNVNNSTLTLE
jgi:hypothetical protein